MEKDCLPARTGKTNGNCQENSYQLHNDFRPAFPGEGYPHGGGQFWGEPFQSTPFRGGQMPNLQKWPDEVKHISGHDAVALFGGMNAIRPHHAGLVVNVDEKKREVAQFVLARQIGI